MKKQTTALLISLAVVVLLAGLLIFLMAVSYTHLTLPTN